MFINIKMNILYFTRDKDARMNHHFKFAFYTDFIDIIKIALL